MPLSPVKQALGRLERMLRGSALLRVPGVRAVKEMARERMERYLSGNVPVEVGEFSLLMPRRFIPNYTGGPYEAITQASFRDLLRPGMTVVDVGAHIGYTTVLAARLVGPGGRVHAFEPAGENLEFLRRNVALNALQNVSVHDAAVGNASCEREFHLTGSSDSHGFYAHPHTGTLRTLKVRQVRLDDAVRGPVDAVKVDVEGAELEVFEGMERILAENPRLAVWVEWNPSCMRNAGYDPLLLPRRMRELGFRVSVLDDRGGATPPLEETMARVEGGGTPDFWYVNLLGVREG